MEYEGTSLSVVGAMDEADDLRPHLRAIARAKILTSLVIMILDGTQEGEVAIQGLFLCIEIQWVL